MDNVMQKESSKYKKILLYVASRFKKKEETAQSCEKKKLLAEIEEALADIRYAKNCFEEAREPEIIEACIYEIKSAEARYNFLLRKAKLMAEHTSGVSV
ncbi:MAG: DUF2508 family protein [Oscillospiraceae bacterium]|nr:DUF2508 family protein [Oscillospiraceae bacterium]